MRCQLKLCAARCALSAVSRVASDLLQLLLQLTPTVHYYALRRARAYLKVTVLGHRSAANSALCREPTQPLRPAAAG